MTGLVRVSWINHVFLPALLTTEERPELGLWWLPALWLYIGGLRLLSSSAFHVGRVTPEPNAATAVWGWQAHRENPQTQHSRQHQNEDPVLPC